LYIFIYSIENLVLGIRSEIAGFAENIVPECWSTGVLDLIKIPKNKSQTPNKSQ
jgi:hypothetical protein